MFSVVQLVDEEMFWVATEVCSESNIMKRVRIIKQFIKIASKLFLAFFVPQMSSVNTLCDKTVITNKLVLWPILQNNPSLLLVCVSLTIIGQPRNSVLIRRV